MSDYRIGDFISYFPKILSEDMCDNIVVDLRENLITPKKEPDWVRMHMTSDNKNYKYLSECVLKVKQQYLNERPTYAEKYHTVSGENDNDRLIEKWNSQDNEFNHSLKKILIQYYPTGSKMGMHVDNTGRRVARSRGKAERWEFKRDTEYPYSQLSCLLYLNDDYDGGEFVVADQEYKTAKGSAVIFPSNFMYPHMVRKITRGERWSLGVFLR